MPRLLALVALLFAFPAHAVVTIDWVSVSDPGNACDTQSQGCFGAVSYDYLIGKYEVTNAQYVAFLNAVAATDTHGLYNTEMGSGEGGITRSESAGSYSYNAIAGRENMPVILVSSWDATRFTNWLHNGQPTGAQDSTTTEDGAYTLTPTDIANNTVTRNAGAAVFVTSEAEWYKAAYYKGGGTSAGYWDYPAGSDTQTSCTTPGATANTANCNLVEDDLTDGGSYTGSASPSGTFDQGGNVWEWNEAIIGGLGRGFRGGGFIIIPDGLAASNRSFFGPSLELNSLGFRVASPFPPVILPNAPSLGPLGLLVVAASLLGFGAYRRGRK